MTALVALRSELADATARFLATAASLTGDEIAAPSALPGWSRGHVLAHVASNAGSHVNLLTWARTGVRTPQYPSVEARAADIEAAASRTPAAHLSELRSGAARLAAAIDSLPAPAWRATVEGMRPPPHPAWYVLVRRLREVEIHHVDLDAGYGPPDWPRAFVRRELHDCLRSWPHTRSTISAITVLDNPVPASGSPAAAYPATTSPADDRPVDKRPAAASMTGRDGDGRRTWTGLGPGPAVEGDASDLLAWLTGRSGGEGVRVVSAGRPAPPVPVAPPWLTMPAPADLPATPPKDYP
ncbi:maleylpyruvate isomerase family mycothiol-dependent enzyme [Nonomuraea rhizosphaerae]|uniref:maleylpyruvate isomerase family mycothiol-dependent enzyme n=1 Tax=Nonomuraea rhizosphaerae TaxID=2665663 RepID=UPI001C5E49DA|nr:maleylpyruvate isomerase family mycothiol-dependent enzyme [Nonomuraea rhizosphaerae]